MTWWGTPLSDLTARAQPKQKSRFLLLVGGKPVLTVKTVTKPSAEIETKTYKMINHYYNYPGLVKWNPVEVTLVDGDAAKPDPFGGGSLATAEEMWRMLMFSGYATPDMTKNANYRAPNLSTPEKASLIDRSAAKQIQIAHLDPSGEQTIEFWDLINPMITKFDWGSLDYGSDELVEYSFTITYDWARWYQGNPGTTDTEKRPVDTRIDGGTFYSTDAGLDGIKLPGESEDKYKNDYNK